MSGITGIWNLDGRPLESALLAAMSSRQSHRGPDEAGRWVEGPVGLACQMLRVAPESAAGFQPVVHRSGVVAVFDGRIDNREDFLSAFTKRDLSADSSDAALVLAAYDALGERFVERLNGDFALGVFDPRRRRLLLARDPIGIRPLHYCFARETFLFASEIKCLLAHPQVSAAPDEDALADFLLHGYVPDGRTFFKNICTVPPAHLTLLTLRGFTTRRYWDFDTTRHIRFGSFGEYAEGFNCHFAQAVRRRLRTSGTAAVAVSGGLDSSAIFCVAQRESRHGAGIQAPMGLSQLAPAGSRADEQAFLLDIERDYGAAIERVSDGVPGIMRQARDELWHVEAPFLDALGNRHHEFLRAVSQRGVRVLLSGHWGDQMLCEQRYLVDLARRFEWTTVWAHLKEYPRWYDDVERPGFTREFFRDLVRHHAPDVMVTLARRFRAKEKPPLPALAWYTGSFRLHGNGPRSRPAVPGGPRVAAHAQSMYREVRNSYHVLCMESNDKAAAMYGMEMAFPFLDRDLLSFLMAIPGEMQTWKGISKALLREGLRGVVPASILERRGKADFSDLTNSGMERDLPQVIECVRSPGTAIELGYVERHAIITELQRLNGRIRGPDCSVAWALQELLSLELWLEVFVTNSHSAAEPQLKRPAHPR